MEACIGDARRLWLDADALDLLRTESAARTASLTTATYDAEKLRDSLEKGTKKVSLLKDSEKRKLRDRLRLAFSPALETDAAMDAVLSSKSAVTVGRLGSTRNELYCVDEQPAFLLEEPQGASKQSAAKAEFVMFPQVLARCPHVVRQIAVHAPVRKNICRGADLFGAGIVGANDLNQDNAWARALLGGAVQRGEMVALVAYQDGQCDVAPFAVGRFAKSDEDMLTDGLRGVAVEILLSTTEDLTDSFDIAVEAMRHAVSTRSEAVEAAATRRAFFAKKNAGDALALQLVEDGKQRKRIEKLLRAIAELSLKPYADLNSEQRGKLAKMAELQSQLSDIDRRAEEAAAPPLPEVEAAAPLPEVVEASTTDVDDDAAGEEQEEDEQAAAEEEEEEEEDTEAAIEEEEVPADVIDVDGLFTRGLLTTLSKSKLPALLSELCASAARLCGHGVKETRWKKASKFVEDHPGLLKTRERQMGVTEVYQADLTVAGPFEELEEKPQEIAAASQLRATKRGGRVTVTCRRVRNTNCTFIDGLDSWGFTYETQKLLASRFAKKFAASASVAERKGSKDSDRQFWSVMVQGKYVEQIAKTLRVDHGVTDVKSVAPKGLVTKKDRATNV